MARAHEQATPNRHDRRRAETRQALLGAARALITEKGISGLRIGEITGRADVALGSFYNHFDSKEALVEAVVAESLEALTGALATPTQDDQDPAELVSTAIRRFMGLASEDPSFARLVVQLHDADAVFAGAVNPAARRAVQLGLDAGRFDVPDTEVAVIAIVGGSVALLRAIMEGRLGEGAPEAHAEGALRLLGVPSAEARDLARRELPVREALAAAVWPAP